MKKYSSYAYWRFNSPNNAFSRPNQTDSTDRQPVICNWLADPQGSSDCPPGAARLPAAVPALCRHSAGIIPYAPCEKFTELHSVYLKLGQYVRQQVCRFLNVGVWNFEADEALLSSQQRNTACNQLCRQERSVQRANRTVAVYHRSRELRDRRAFDRALL